MVHALLWPRKLMNYAGKYANLRLCMVLGVCLPRIVTPPSESSKVEHIASLQEPRFKDLVISVSPDQILDIYGKKKDFKNREKEIGLL